MAFPIAHLFCSLDGMCVSSLTPSPGSTSVILLPVDGGTLQKCLAIQRQKCHVFLRLGPGEEQREVLLYLEEIEIVKYFFENNWKIDVLHWATDFLFFLWHQEDCCHSVLGWGESGLQDSCIP